MKKCPSNEPSAIYLLQRSPKNNRNGGKRKQQQQHRRRPLDNENNFIFQMREK
jgi:hypothetical protein